MLQKQILQFARRPAAASLSAAAAASCSAALLRLPAAIALLPLTPLAQRILSHITKLLTSATCAFHSLLVCGSQIEGAARRGTRALRCVSDARLFGFKFRVKTLSAIILN